MIRIRPGRSWRLNPGYLGELRAVTAPRARSFTGAEILDVLGVEVDGVDIAAGVGEAQVLVAVDDLVQALLRLGDGEPAAQATIGPGPTELVLEARGYDVLVTLVSLAPPARLLASGLLLDAARLRAAALSAARGLLLDLIAISPVLARTPLAKRLGAGCRALSRKTGALGSGWPAAGARALAVKGTGAGAGKRDGAARAEGAGDAGAAGKRELRCEISAPGELMARIAARAEVASAPLAAHLARGTVTLRLEGAPALTCEEPLLLTLRNLVREAAALIEAWEAGDRIFALPFGPLELRCDLTRDELRAPGFSDPWAASPAELATAIASAVQAFADRALRTAGRAPDELLADLRTRARELLRHCRDLSSGDLHRSPGVVSAPPSPAPRARLQPLSEGRIRRLLFRELFREEGVHVVRPPLLLPQGPLVLPLEDALEARSAQSGEKLWRMSAAPGAVEHDGDLVFSEPGDAVVRLDPQTGEVRWRRRLRAASHPAELWPIAGGVVRALPGEGIAFVTSAGTLAFRTRLPGGAPVQAVLAQGVIVVALTTGAIAGLDATDGRILWKRRTRALALEPVGPRVLVLANASLSSLEAASGEPVWERPLPPGATEPKVAGDLALLISAGRVHGLALPDGAQRVSVPLPWAQELSVADDPDEHGHRGATVLVTGAGGAAQRLDERGVARWSLATDGTGPAAPALLQRGVVLLQRGGTSLHDAALGTLLAKLAPARYAALAPDLTCALLDEDGTLSVHHLATHLSVV